MEPSNRTSVEHKCVVCGKVFTSRQARSDHRRDTGHASFLIDRPEYKKVRETNEDGN